MSKSRKRGYVLCLLLVSLIGTVSCSEKSEEAGKKDEKTNYLDIDVLSEEKKVDVKTYQIQYGTFEEKLSDLNTSARSKNYLEQPIKAMAEGEQMVLEGTDKLENYVFVEKGDVLARIVNQEKSTDVLETELKLQRLQNNLNRDNQYYQEEHEEKIKEYEEKKKEPISETKKDISTEAKRRIYYIEREKELNIERLSLEREALEWENKKKNYEREIEYTKAELEKLHQKADAVNVIAPRSGYVIKNMMQINTGVQIEPGEQIKKGDIIGYIFDFTQQLMFLNNSENIYTYGMTCNWQLSNGTKRIEIPGKMINGDSSILYGNLDSDVAFFDFEQETEDGKNILNSFGNGKIKGSLHYLEHVLLVPVDAVTIDDDIHYVTVIKEDGSFLKTGFTPGNSNAEYYWVLSGLEEGMQILLRE